MCVLVSMGVWVCVCWPGPLLVIAKICMQLAHTDSPIDSDKNFLPSPCESLCVSASGCVRVCVCVGVEKQDAGQHVSCI